MFDSSSEFIEKIDNAVRFHFMTSEGIPEESEVRQAYTQYFGAFKILPQFASTICDREAVVDDLVLLETLQDVFSADEAMVAQYS